VTVCGGVIDAADQSSHSVDVPVVILCASFSREFRHEAGETRGIFPPNFCEEAV
jgi:hypothetical protein